MDWKDLAVVSQIACTGWFASTHWIPLPPLNDLQEEAFPNERLTNFILHVLQLASILGFFFHLIWVMWFGIFFWTISLIGHLFSWWLPYFFGWPKAFLKNAELDNVKTYHFLPPRKNHPIPDLNHCVIGFLLLYTMVVCWMAILS